MFPGTFIEPDDTLIGHPDPNGRLGIPVSFRHHYRYRSHLSGQNRIFHKILEKLGSLDYPFDDQCTLQYYFDLTMMLRDYNGQFGRVVEVGTYMGGASSFFGCATSQFDFDLDLVDIDARYLRSAYERIRRCAPESLHRVRIFHGDLPSYVAHVLLHEDSGPVIVHHDASHAFADVVRDMSALSFVREKLLAVVAQDTNLRSGLDIPNFVDLALYAVFGTDVKCAAIGTVCRPEETRARPDAQSGYYFTTDAPEGVVIPMALNSFRYPHPDTSLAEILDPQRGRAVREAA